MAFLDTNIFAKIITGELPSNKVYENDRVLAFHDITPKADTHILIIPKQELVTAKEITEENKDLFGELILVAKEIAEDIGLNDYKLHMNVGEGSGQTVPHVHLHLLSPDFKTGL